MEIENICIDDFPLLFGSYGICRNVNEQFIKILKRLDLFNQEAIELQRKLTSIINKVKGWLEKDLSADAVDYYTKGISTLYPTETPPKDQVFDITYQERYSIGKQFVSERKNCNEKMQKCLEMCDDPDQLLKGSIIEICSLVKIVRNQLFKLNFLVEKNLNDSTNLNQDFNQIQVQLVSLLNNIDSKIEKYQNDITTSKEKVDLCQELLDATELQFNRVRLGRTPAYSDQMQNCTQFTNITYIGDGGFATVYRATWINGLGIWDYALGKRVRHQNTEVALKYLHGQEVDPKFFEEAILSSRVLHCYGISKDPNSKNYIMVLPYAHGGDLLNYIKKRWKRMKWINRLHILRHLTYGIVDIHNKDLVHHDLHPGNLFHYQKLLAVADLGLCRPVNEKSSEKLYGVIRYAAPEYLRGNPYTQAADIYSIGMIMWLLALGEHPFSDIKYNNKSDQEYDINLTLDICEGLRPEIPNEIPTIYAELMQKCWSEDQNARPTAEEVYLEVKRWIFEIENPPSKITQQFDDNITLLNKNISEYSYKNYRSQDLSKISENLKCYDSFSLLTLSPHSKSSENSMLNVEKKAETSLIRNKKSTFESNKEKAELTKIDHSKKFKERRNQEIIDIIANINPQNGNSFISVRLIRWEA
ncbi:13065_t:CDS:2 [Cetraspora pellucida]|uniref:13065_t:CDS:1 n=1 Tax=Cetraspora pellucida TaxID=1433469 RepID=A0A9N9II20_9GLOM|nr:13065_t:CDS:2 [Cetraspora pellucida]